jgi:hypothetical protein
VVLDGAPEMICVVRRSGPRLCESACSRCRQTRPMSTWLGEKRIAVSRGAPCRHDGLRNPRALIVVRCVPCRMAWWKRTAVGRGAPCRHGGLVRNKGRLCSAIKVIQGPRSFLPVSSSQPNREALCIHTDNTTKLVLK